MVGTGTLQFQLIFKCGHIQSLDIAIQSVDIAIQANT